MSRYQNSTLKQRYKNTRFSLLLPVSVRDMFFDACLELEKTPSEVTRALIENFLEDTNKSDNSRGE